MVIGKTAARVMTSHLPTVSSGRVAGGLAVSRISFQPSRRSRRGVGDATVSPAGVGVAVVLIWGLGASGNVRCECITFHGTGRSGIMTP